MGTLERLSFEEGGLNDQSCVWLANVIERGRVLAPQLVRLDFSTAFQGADGPARLFQSIGTYPAAFKILKTLRLFTKFMTVDVCQALGTALQKHAFPELQALCLSGTPIESIGLASLLRGLERSACANTLRDLNLSRCGITAIGVEALGLAIGRDCLPSLQVLLLNG